MVVCGIEEKDKERAERMVKIALWCVQYKPEARPLMSVVVRMLEGAVEIPRPSVNPFQNLKPGTLHPNKPVGSAFHSERTSASGSISFQTVTEFSVVHATPFMTKYDIDIVCT